MQQERTFTPTAKGAVMGSSFPAAGKPARPFAPSAGANTVLPSGIFYGRNTMLSSSSLGDSVSQRGEALGSLTPRGADGGQRDGHAPSRTALFGGREITPSRQVSTAWRPPAGLPLPGSDGTTVSCNSSSSGAGSVGRNSNYAEASAAASFYKQRQQQHSPCIFGDGSDCASVARCVPADHATGAEPRLQQRVPCLEDGDTGSRCSRNGRQQKPQSDKMRAAGVPTATWHSHRQQQQRKLLPAPEAVEPSLQESQQGANPFLSAEPQLQQNSQICPEETLRLQVHHLQQPPISADQQGQTHPPPRQHAARPQQSPQGNSGTGVPSRVQGLMDMPSSNETSQRSTREQQRQHVENELSNSAVVQEEMQDSAHDDMRPILACKSSNTQQPDFHCSAVEFVQPPEGSTASSGGYSPSPASPSTPLPEEHEVILDHRQQQQRCQQQLFEIHSTEEAPPRTTELNLSDKPSATEGRAAAASPSPTSPQSSRSRWQPRAEEESAFSALRGSRDTSISRGPKGPDVSSFVPREDLRSCREKQIQALRSTGSVMPLSVAADAAVAAAAAAASFRCHGSTSGGRGSADGGVGDSGVGGSREGSRDAHAAPYPLNLMGRGSEQRDAGRRAAARAGCSRLLPLDIAWHSSAASVLGNRESLSHGGAGHGAGSSPTSNGSGGLFSPASSNCSQPAYGQQLTARERLLHQHCTSSVFAGEEEDSSEAGNRPARQGLPSSTAGATSHRATPLQECEYGTKDENLQRRADQLQNPWYSDLFGRHTPKRSPTTTRCAAAAVLANGPEPEATSARDGEDTQGTAGPAAPTTGNAVLGVDGATLDKLCAYRRKTQLLRAPNAYERFINAMQSDIWSNVGDDGDAMTEKRLMRAHLAKETLLQEKCREQRRRQRLKEAVKEGHGKYFHMATSDEARVGEMGKNMDFLGLQVKRPQPAKRSTAELHLFGVRPDMTEEDIEKLCRAEGGDKGDKDKVAESISETAAHSEGGVKSSRGGLPKCSLQVKLATNILTSQCKGTGKVILQYQDDEVDIEQVVRRLRDANVGVRQVS